MKRTSRGGEMKRRDFLKAAAAGAMLAAAGRAWPLTGAEAQGAVGGGDMASRKGAGGFLEAFDRWQMPPDRPRPRLFVPGDMLGRLRDLQAEHPADWERLQQAADGALARGEARSASLAVLGLAYRVTGKADYAALASEHVERVLKVDDWVLSTHRAGGLSVDLGVAHQAAQVALAYDWLYPYLSAETRERWREAIIARGLALFLPVHREGSEWWARSLHNWRAVICGEMGQAAMAVMGEWPQARESLRESLAGMLATLDANPEDGSYVEGLGYWSYGIGRTAWFAEALRTVTDGAVDLFQHSYMKRTAEFALYLTTPDLGSFNFGDDHYSPPSGELLSLLAARTGDAHAQWLAGKLDAWHPLGVFWKADAPRPEPPDGLPLAKHFAGAGTTILRSDWSEQAVYIGLKTGRTTANHSHLDINSFIVNAFGKRLLVDPGSWHYDHAGGFFDVGDRRWDYPGNATEAHSTLLVEGEGQQWGEEHRGELVHLESSPAFRYAVAQAGPAYGARVRTFLRHLVLAGESYAILVDYVETDDPVSLQWLFQTGVEADLSQLSEGRVCIENDPAALEMDLLWPDAEARTVRKVELVSHYLPAWDARPRLRQEGFGYVSVAPLHRQSKGVLAMVVRPRLVSSPPSPAARLLKREEDQVSIAVADRDGETHWVVRLSAPGVERVREAGPAA